MTGPAPNRSIGLRRGLSFAVTGAAGLATWLAASPWLRAYHMAGTGLVLGMAAFLPVLLPVLLDRLWHPPSTVSYACSAVAALVLMLALVALNPADLARGLIHGPSRLVTDTLPLSSPRWLLVPAVSATWLTGAATSEHLLRTRGTGLPAAMVLASYVGSYAVTSSAPAQNVVIGALLLGVLATMVMSRRLLQDLDRPRADSQTDGGGASGLRARLAWAGLALVVAVTAALVVPALPGTGRPPASVARATPTTSNLAVTPVAAMASLRDSDPGAAPVTLVTAQLDGPSTGYLSLATLDQYDGDVWSFDRTFRPTGGRIPSAPAGSSGAAQPLSSAPLHQRYTLLRPFGTALPFLPAIDRPIEVSGLSVDVDITTGMTVPSKPLRLPATYTVTSAAPSLGLERVPAATTLAVVSDPSDRLLPAPAGTDLSGVLTYLSALTGLRPAPTVAFLQSVLSAFQKVERKVDAASVPRGVSTVGGTSLSEVLDAVTVNQKATPEQFATFFAVVARLLGVPARLATGFRIQDSAAGLVDAGRHELTNRQAWTWVEIPLSGFGWVVADPTPIETAAGNSPASQEGQAPMTTVAPLPANAVPNSAGGHALAPPVSLKLPRHQRRSLLLWLLVSAMGLVVLTFLVVPGLVFGVTAARRTYRRRLRRAADPEGLAVGAWLEVLDALWRLGVEPGQATTTTDVAARAGHHFGPELAEPVRSVGELADRALYSRHSPVDEAAARAAWNTQLAVGRQMRARSPRPRRIRSRMTVGFCPRGPVAEPRRNEPTRRGPGR